MFRRTIFVALALAVPVLGTGIAVAGSSKEPTLKAVKAATAHFRDPAVAEAAGYTLRLPDTSGATCITQAGSGTMGIHFVNTNLLDTNLNAYAPEVLVYEPQKNGGLKLVAVEYVTFQEAWDKAQNAPAGQHATAPRMFGRPFDFVASPNRYGLPAFYALHAWAWAKNPSGAFFAWNPKVSCP
jgi:hypothetical protein